MEMELAELGFDDEDILGEEGQVHTGDPDDDVKRWMEGDVPEGDYLDNNSDNNPDNNPDEEDDLLTSVLKAKGINPEAIKVRNDEGEIEEIPFTSLTKEEQLDLLNYSPAEDEYGLEPEEINLINELRQNNLSVQDYLKAHRQQAIQDYLDGLEEQPQYQVDDLSDEQLFLADLKANVPDLTDEEAQAQLDLEKQNEALFTKKMAGLRNVYKEREDALIQQTQQDYEEKQRQADEAYENSILEAIRDNETIDFGESELTLSEDDMNEIASFILDSDAAGVRYLARAIQDPQMLVQMAWFALKGPEALRQISEYYKHQITEQSRTNYKKGYEDAKAGRTSNPTKTVVKRPEPRTAPTKGMNINDLD